MKLLPPTPFCVAQSSAIADQIEVTATSFGPTYSVGVTSTIVSVRVQDAPRKGEWVQGSSLCLPFPQYTPTHKLRHNARPCRDYYRDSTPL
jgi:hypothetical protein